MIFGNRIEKLVKAAQEYDRQYRPKAESWRRVPDSQVLRLLIGAGAVKSPEDAQ